MARLSDHYLGFSRLSTDILQRLGPKGVKIELILSPAAQTLNTTLRNDDIESPKRGVFRPDFSIIDITKLPKIRWIFKMALGRG